ncbi:hypothetical protein [Stieleria varia]|uniref:Uncharacterized protein n=1 Tax=Stieleria varia TaxID=2528005 RepID=A0A5C6B8C0_9BACT|nr:hypothetical protein [Stieleria varia]TWU07681.1 hypothetical protein Pla52n_02540 [Stieleria varia]
MAARDDSVIRGSLITCLIFLVLSLALNFILWRWGDTQATTASNDKTALRNAQDEIRNLEERAITYKAMLGQGQLSQDQFNALKTSQDTDQDMNEIAKRFVDHMTVFGPDVEVQDKNYAKLPDYLLTTIRSRNEQYGDAIEQVAQIRKQADADVDIANKAQQQAETERDTAQKSLETERDAYAKDRARINTEREKDRDKVTSITRDFDQFRRKKLDETRKLSQKLDQYTLTIETQRIQLNELQSDRFESVQGEIRSVRRGGEVCSINLGSADALRPGITFGVVDRNDRLEDAEVKATLQVTKILGQHLAEARVIARPRMETPIIEGDYVYSPFWAPGREVKIALAGDIDIDGDSKPDNSALVGMIQAAGAKVSAAFLPNGQVEGKLDSSIRFMVTGEAPDLDGPNADENAAQIAIVGKAREKARELGITIIPAWKLQAYLRRLDDSLTTPLGSAARGEDFPPIRASDTTSRLPTVLPELYTRQLEGMQKGNEIKP